MVAISLLAIATSFLPQIVFGRAPSVLIGGGGGGNGSVALIPHVGKHSVGLTAFELALTPNRYLYARQSGCPTGYAPCTGDPTSCCPVGGECCLSQDGCCPRGQFCYSTGCCDDGEFGCSGNTCCPRGSVCCSGGGCCAAGNTCVVVGGVGGCCPVGQTCSGTGGSCSIATDIPCAGEDFCCPPGDRCGRDASGAPTCIQGGGSTPPPVTPPTTTTTTPTTTRPPPTTTITSQVITFRPTTTTSVGGGSGGAAPSQSAAIFTQSFPAAPTPGASMQNNTVGATDPRISYTGNWGTGTSCQGPSRRATQEQSSLRFQFIGTAIYMNTVAGPGAGVFHASIDGKQVEVDGFTKATTTECKITWSEWGMGSTLHTVEITYIGASRASSSSSSSGIEFSNFIVTSDGTGDSESSGSGGASSADPTASPKSPLGWFILAFTPLLAAFSLI